MNPDAERSKILTEFSARIAAAKAREQDERDSIFVLDYKPDICGIPVRDLSLNDLNLLLGQRNPFLCGGFPDQVDVFLFLWYMSPRFSQSRFKRWLFRWHVRKVNCLDAIVEIRKFLDDRLKELPKGDGKERSDPSKASFLAHSVHRFAKAYGWTDEEILRKPITRLLQYQRVMDAEISAEAGKPTPCLLGESDKLYAEMLKKLNELKKAQSENV